MALDNHSQRASINVPFTLSFHSLDDRYTPMSREYNQQIVQLYIRSIPSVILGRVVIRRGSISAERQMF